jgi:uncharacterized protein YndB with AHSA1/START domain
MDLHMTTIPVGTAGMLIRKPANEVYEAFVNPAITTKFWFTRSSGKLEAGKYIRWDWEMYGVSTMVDVKELVAGKRILVVWDIEKDPTRVEWNFSAITPDTTYVSITNSGFIGDGDKVVEQAIGSSAGFELVLAGLKAWLEHGIKLNLIEDRHPDNLMKQPALTASVD